MVKNKHYGAKIRFFSISLPLQKLFYRFDNEKLIYEPIFPILIREAQQTFIYEKK